MSLQLRLTLNNTLNNTGLAESVITNNGATVGTDGINGSCYTFNGTTSFISLSNLNKYFVGGTNSFSICFWLKHLGNNRRGIILGNYGLSGANRSVNIEITTSNILRFWWGGNPDLRTTVPIVQNVWCHYAIVYNGSSLKFYKDGVLSYTLNVTLNVATENTLFYLGRDYRTGETALYGKMNDFRIYDNALSVKEIKEIYNNTFLIAHYTFSDPYVFV